jgi:hypothetical protein
VSRRNKRSNNPAVLTAEKSIAVDFDTPLHRYSRGWHTKDIYDPPTPGAYAALKELSARFGVFVLTARPAKDVLPWCQKHFPTLRFELIADDVTYWDKLGVIGVTNRKLPALAYIDDRAIRFTHWGDMLNYFR